jgi:hypothetical protein
MLVSRLKLISKEWSQCHRRDVCVPSIHQLSQPVVRLGPVLGESKHRSRTVDQQGAQVGVSALADELSGTCISCFCLINVKGL